MIEKLRKYLQQLRKLFFVGENGGINQLFYTFLPLQGHFGIVLCYLRNFPKNLCNFCKNQKVVFHKGVFSTRQRERDVFWLRQKTSKNYVSVCFYLYKLFLEKIACNCSTGVGQLRYMGQHTDSTDTLSFTAERARRTSDCAHWGGLSNVYQVMFNTKSSEWTASW